MTAVLVMLHIRLLHILLGGVLGCSATCAGHVARRARYQRCWGRIATGRDAADTAFLDNHNGAITMQYMMVTAVVDGELPQDSVDELVSLR
jgi:hypothetical protein